MLSFSYDEVQPHYGEPYPKPRRHDKQRPQKSRPQKSRNNIPQRIMGGAMLVLLFLAMIAIVIYFVYFGKKWWRHGKKIFPQ